MIKKIVKIFLIVSVFVGVTVSAGSSDYKVDTYSLVGFEAGYGSISIDDNAGGTDITTTHKFPHAGIKIGAESEDYRLFLSVRYFNADQLEYLTTYGAELQYMFNFSSFMNFYIGINGGMANSKIIAAGVARTISDTYIGADIGINMHLKKSIDLEIGVRTMNINAKNTIGDVTYIFDNITTGYVSVIYKYKMD